MQCHIPLFWERPRRFKKKGSTIIRKNNETNDKFYLKVEFLMYTEMVHLGLKAEKQLRNKNYIEDWALGCHHRDNCCHVTH